jgi:predicted phosphodiesterase
MAEMEHIGIMADSHGDYEKLGLAVEYLIEQNCTRLYHLGDIGDTNDVNTFQPCIEILKNNNIIAIKGNNDHNMAINNIPRGAKQAIDATGRYLDQLPLTVELGAVIFAHSLPFVEELGTSAMVRPLDERALKYYFSRYHERILVRGHNHTPEIIFEKDDRFIFRKFRTGQELNLSDLLPAVVTCGALLDNHCMILRLSDNGVHNSISCHGF